MITAMVLALAMMFAPAGIFPGGTETVNATTPDYRVSVASGYLALRTAMAFDSRNEIGALYNGDTVCYISPGNSTYWYVYSPKLNKYGYVNKNYLVAISNPAPTPSYDTSKPYTVKVNSGYLALRTAMAFDSRNEIGSLYSGETVYYQWAGNDTYWWVYSPKYGTCGYVNRNYLIGAGSSAPAPSSNVDTSCPYTVSVASGYLALRNAMAFDSRNEIGSLYSGETVYYQWAGNNTYWWVYSPKYGTCGYVNRNYLIGAGSSTPAPSNSVDTSCPKTVSVASGYLALRNAMAFSSSNEIGQLYTGETVYYQWAGNDTYWWVYSPKYGCCGYVNRNYLY